MKKLKNAKSKKRLFTRETTYFVGNHNKIQYYIDISTGRLYAQACFDYNETTYKFQNIAWFQLNQEDLKNEEAQLKTELEIIRYLGYINIK